MSQIFPNLALQVIMQPLVGNTEHHIKNSAHFVKLLKDIKLKEHDLLVSFDVESLFTMVPINDTLKLLMNHFSSEILELFRHCLTSSYFLWNDQFYEQIDGVAMGGPLSPVVANFFMEWFEKTALDTAPKRPKNWFRYVDDTFVVWQHGKDSLLEFLAHLNNIHSNIKFTMEIESNNKLPFLDVLVYKKETGDLGHSVYRKPTHTDRYLNANSNHHPSQKRALIKTLVHRAKTISDDETLKSELFHLSEALKSNGYAEKLISSVIHPNRTYTHETVDESSTQPKAYLPYLSAVTDRISRILRKEGIRTVFKPSQKICNIIGSVKDKIDPLKTPGIYSIPCECGSEYIGMTDRSIATRRKEHARSIRLNQPEKSAVAEHALTEGHCINFVDTKVLARVKGFHNLARREAIEIAQRPNNMNRDKGAGVSKFWSRLLSNKQLSSNTCQNMPSEQTCPKSAETNNGQTSPKSTDSNNRQTSPKSTLMGKQVIGSMTGNRPIRDEHPPPTLVYNGPRTRSRAHLSSVPGTVDNCSSDLVKLLN